MYIKPCAVSVLLTHHPICSLSFPDDEEEVVVAPGTEVFPGNDDDGFEFAASGYRHDIWED